MWIVQVIVGFLVLHDASPARILTIFPTPVHSHYIIGHTLNEGLVAKGHQVTMVSALGYKNKGANQNYVDIVLEGLEDFLNKEMNSEDLEIEDREAMSLFLMQYSVHWFGLSVGEYILNHTNVQKLLKDQTQHFDLVISQQFFMDATKGFCWHYGVPCVAFSTVGASQITNYLVGNPSPPSYIPDVMLPYSAPMSFLARAHNFVYQTYSTVIYNLIFLAKQNDLLQKYFPGAPHLSELNKNVSLVLLNSHVSTNQALPRVSNMVEVGGMHVKPAKKLPQNLQKYLDDGTEGVIYFSLGSHLKSADTSEKFKQVLLNVFGKLKYKVLWKYEDDSLKNIPDNVMINNWLPQQDILGHPNVILFITHGGLLSTIEAVYNGVPVVGIPFFGDQKLNMKQTVRNGFGTYVLVKDFTEATFESAINEVLHNKKYRENAKKRSKLMHDRPMQPLDEAVWWLEHVIRHNGGDHLRNAGVDLTWYQYHMLDVIFVFLMLPIFVIWAACKVLKCKNCGKCSVKPKYNVKKNQ